MAATSKQVIARERNWHYGRLSGMCSSLCGMINGVYSPITIEEQIKLDKARTLIKEVLDSHSESNKELGLKK